jgi:Lrp/AsnC family transcriptional regulator, leucine-responsive regulatory protein
MDDIDLKVIGRLQLAGRESWAALGELVGMTGPAAAERVRRLEEAGVIRGYAALLDPESVGATVTAFVAVDLDRPEHRKPFLARVAALSEVQECHHVAGDHDYLLKIRCGGTRELERVVSEELKGVSGVARTRTIVVLRTEKETPAIPLAAPEPSPGRRGR